jgi:transposase
LGVSNAPVSRTRQARSLKIKPLIVRVSGALSCGDSSSCGQQLRAAANARNFSGLHQWGVPSVRRHRFRISWGTGIAPAARSVVVSAGFASGVRADGAQVSECKMQPPARLKPLTLTRDEREQLEQWVRNCQGSRPLALRARIVLSCQAGCSNRDSAKRLKVTAQTVGKWRARFVAQGIPGLADQPRSGAPRSISDAMVEAVLAKTLHSKPPDAARWSSRRLAATVGVSQRTVLRIWRAFGL